MKPEACLRRDNSVELKLDLAIWQKINIFIITAGKA
jgi:hypothetical protein